MSFVPIQEERLWPELFGRPPARRRCPRCGKPLQEYLVGRYRCTGCRLVPNSCVCPRPGPSLLDFEEELAVQGVAP